GAKREAQFSPDSKEVYFLDQGRIQVVPVEAGKGTSRSVPVAAELDVDFEQEKMVEREVVVRPLSRDTEKALDYRQWVEERRAYVAKASGGKLGYVHMFDMSAASLSQLYLDLDAENMSRDGVVVDVRNNNGGFVNVYAID
nr:hypothetical protein [Tanacetum cinerariifolium]